MVSELVVLMLYATCAEYGEGVHPTKDGKAWEKLTPAERTEAASLAYSLEVHQFYPAF